ncbi:uncharacterized protein LOC113313880 [Papaver somniferum]|uniref:uncharacterized protein LOC113313880 n=1 Tax=Papaver somniferum TaxID=3469 RepID=UPI000E6FD308|nr:uncharacterized protein LOC113313880 [Papaver somniferum]
MSLAGNIRFLSLNTAVTVYHGVCRVQTQASPSHVLLPWDACGNCFARLLMRAHTPAVTVSIHWFHILNLNDDFVDFPVSSLVKPVCGSEFSWVVYQPMMVSTKLEFFATMSGIKVFLVVSQFLHVLLRVAAAATTLFVHLPVVLAQDSHWTIFLFVTVHSNAPLYCVLMSILKDGWDLTGSPSTLVTATYVFKFFTVFKNAVMRYIEFLELLKVTVWVSVKKSIRGQFLGAPEFKQLQKGVIRTVLVRSGATWRIDDILHR